MKQLWLENGEQFYPKLFAYLKRKFPHKYKAVQLVGKNNADVSIYHETIVALEQVHEVLRKIANRAAPSRDDYDVAVKENDVERVQSIIDFYQKLVGVTTPELCDAYKIFYRNYYWDYLLARYVSFVDENSALHEKFLSSLNSKKNTLEVDSLFLFIEAYQVALLKEGGISPNLAQDIQKQNEEYKRLVADYDELVREKVPFGVSVFDVILPSTLDAYITRDEFLPTNFFFKVVRDLEDAFRHDDAVMMQIRHVHIAQKDKYVVSYLVLYKASVHKTSQDFIKWCESILLETWGWHTYDKHIHIFDHEFLIEKLYSPNVFIGRLTSKQQHTFRNTFLKYFYSSIFLFRMDKGSKFQNEEEFKRLVLNSHQFWKEKIYLDEGRLKREQPTQKTVPDMASEYLSDLLDDFDLNKIDKYFTRRNLADRDRECLRLLEYLYRQQSIIPLKAEFIDDLMRIEIFLVRLKYDPVFEFSNILRADKFQKSPRMDRLSILFQQFMLVSQISSVISDSSWRIKPRTSAFIFIQLFSEYFKENYHLSELHKLRQNLNEYRRDELKFNKDELKVESARLKKAESNAVSIQNYLEQIFKKDVIVMRFVFECSRVRRGKLFDEMFRDYIENLKRRYTAGAKLIGHVGVYVPYNKDHSIDATLLFEFNEHKEIEPEKLKEEVIKYWKEYASIKAVQIKDFNERHGQSDKVIHNPFDEYIGRALTAISVAIVKTENLLNDTYIEIRQGQNKVIKLLVQCLTEFYAYCPMVLMDQSDLKNLPRKNYLILGRIRTKNTKKREKVLKHTESAPAIESTEENSVSCLADSDKQNDFIESDNSDVSNAQHVPLEISESADQITQQQPNFEDFPERSENSNQEKELIDMDNLDSVSDTNHTVLIKENKQIGRQAQAKVIHVVPRKKHTFVKPAPDQLAAEAKERFKKT